MKLISDQVDQREIAVIIRELRKCLSTDGDIVELGCYVGTTSLFISEELRNSSQNKRFYVYDSFEGLPVKSQKDYSPAGEQFVPGELLAKKSVFINNFKKHNLPLPVIHKGWFEDLQAADLPEKISFAFLDGDYHSSIMSSLKVIWPKLTKGSIVIVDDYVSDALPGAAKAVNEWLVHNNAKLKIESSLAILYL